LALGRSFSGKTSVYSSVDSQRTPREISLIQPTFDDLGTPELVLARVVQSSAINIMSAIGWFSSKSIQYHEPTPRVLENVQTPIAPNCRHIGSDMFVFIHVYGPGAWRAV
jgi:hypothetical protein